MKFRYFLTFLLAAMLIVAPSCSGIDLPNDNQSEFPQPNPGPEIPDQPNPEIPDQPNPEIPDQPDPETPEPGLSTAVTYDFSGQNCGYCPVLIRSLQDAQNRYPGHYIIVTLHPDPDYSPQLFNQEAQIYQSYMIEQHTIHPGFPNNIFNSLGSYMEPLPVDQLIAQPSILAIETTVNGHQLPLANQNNPDYQTNPDHQKVSSENMTSNGGEKLKINVSTAICKGQQHRIANREFDILLWITENDVIAFQTDNGHTGGYDYYFHHSHLFRGTLNGIWGAKHIPGTSYSHTATVPANVDIAKSQLVVLILDTKTKETIAAAEYSLSGLTAK